MREISGETLIRGKDDQKYIRDGCPSSEKLNAPIVGHFTGVHPQPVSVYQNLQLVKINNQFFWAHSTF
jgi:hypothetical protein